MKKLIHIIKNICHRHKFKYSYYGDLSYERGPTIRECDCGLTQYKFYENYDEWRNDGSYGSSKNE